MLGETTTSELKEKFCMTILRPIGVVGLITPWNFPIAIPAWKIMPALITGNAIVFKPASDTPLLAHKLVEVLIEAGLPWANKSSILDQRTVRKHSPAPTHKCDFLHRQPLIPK